MPLKTGWIVAGCLAAIVVPAAAGEVELPPGTRLGLGAIDDDGQVFFAANGEFSSFLVRQVGERQEIFELPNTPNTSVGRVRLLEGGRLLLDRSRIVKLRADEVVTLWSWDSRMVACVEDADSMHPFCPSPLISADGKVWGVVEPGTPSRVIRPPNGFSYLSDVTDARFTFGRTKKGSKSARTEVVEFGVPDSGDFAGEVSFLWFLDSEGQAVMVPWNGGAYIVHFSDGGSPYTVPVLHDPSSGGSDLRWQQGDRLLWAGSPTGEGRWRAYHLWDLGLSGLPAEPFWEVERNDGWKPHPERGVVRVVEGERRYRIEHLWREPWTGVEEHHVSDWLPGTAPASALGHGWLVSPNGRHAAVIETRQLEDEEGGGVAFSARSVDMLWEPRPLPPVEASAPPADDAEPAKKGAPPSS